MNASPSRQIEKGVNQRKMSLLTQIFHERVSQRQVGRQERSKVSGMFFKSRLAELTAINLPSNIRATLPSMWPIQGNTLTALVLDTHYHSPVKLQKDFYCQVHECLHSIARMDKIQLCIWDMIFPSMRVLVFAKAMKTIFFSALMACYQFSSPNIFTIIFSPNVFRNTM